MSKVLTIIIGNAVAVTMFGSHLFMVMVVQIVTTTMVHVLIMFTVLSMRLTMDTAMLQIIIKARTTIVIITTTDKSC